VLPREHRAGLDELILSSVCSGLFLLGDNFRRKSALFGVASGRRRIERWNFGILLEDELSSSS
jgi:hypothetical protein